MRIRNPWEMGTPGKGISCSDTSEGHHKVLIGSFSLAVGFVVVPQKENDPSTQRLAETVI